VFIDSIYNNGKINSIYQHFPQRFIEFVNEFDCIFTTNYDKNIELATGREVLYLHGALKKFASDGQENANSAIIKFAEGYLN